MTAAANTLFGSGWVWLVASPSGLQILKTAGADTPLTSPGLTPLLTLDVWEHAYYLDYQNVRAEYVNAYFDHLINLEWAEKQLSKA